MSKGTVIVESSCLHRS